MVLVDETNDWAGETELMGEYGWTDGTEAAAYC